MKVAILIPVIGIKGGTQNQLMYLAKNISSLDTVDYRIYTFAYIPDQTYKEFEGLNIKSCITIHKNSIFLRFLSFVSRILNKSVEMILIYLSYIFGWKVKNNIKKYNPDVMNPHDWLSMWWAADIKNNTRAIVFTLNDMPAWFYHESGIKNILMRSVDKKKINKINSIVVLDSTMLKKATKYYPNTRVKVIRSGIDTDKYKNFKCDRSMIRKNLGINNDDFVLICASIPAPHRRFEDVIKAISKIQIDEIKLIIVGDLNYNKKYGDKLKYLVNNLNLKNRVTFISKFLSFEKRSSYIQSSDLFIFPNENQTWGLTVIEAMALNVPVLVSNGAGVHEVIEHKKTGLVYSVGNIDELVDNILWSYNNADTLSEVKNNGRNFALKNFSWNKYATHMIKEFTTQLQ